MQRPLQRLGHDPALARGRRPWLLRFGSGADVVPQLQVDDSFPAASSSTGMRGTFTIPDSMASISEKSLTTHGKMKPSLYPEPFR